MSYFLEDAPSENLALLYRAAQAEPRQALTLLEGYLKPDPMLDVLYYGLTAHCLMALSRQALGENRMDYARELLQQAEQASAQVPDFSCHRQLTLLLHQAQGYTAQDLAQRLPDNTDEQLLRGQAALDCGDADRCIAQLQAADQRPDRWQLLYAQALLLKKEYYQAAACLLRLEDTHPKQVYPLLELCYRELGNFEKAYYYACKQR